MANPTTNYSFAMPTNTDLVKDLPADFEIFGQAVDTKIKDLNPETTAGDISYRGSTANAKTRLGIGTAGQVLTVNSGATAPEWATASSGGLTLLSTTTLSGTSTTISNISGSYTRLMGYIYGITYTSSDNYPRIKVNGSSSQTTVYNTGGAGTSTSATNWFLSSGSYAMTYTDANNAFVFFIDNYASTSNYKPLFSFGGFNASAGDQGIVCNGFYKSNSAVTSLEFDFLNSRTFSTGQVKLYGVK